MQSFILILAFLQCLNVMGKPQSYQHLEARGAGAHGPATAGSLYKRTTSPANLMTCQSAFQKKVINLQDCKKVATFMASKNLSCANYKSCALMTRASVGQPQAVQATSPTQLRYAFSMYFGDTCKVTRQVNPRSKDFPETVDSNLYLTAGICAVGDPSCPTGEQVTACSPEVSAFLKDLPLNPQ